MLAKIFKKNLADRQDGAHPALTRLSKLGARSALCTMIRTADGREISDELGPVSFYRRRDRLFTQDRSLYLAPPPGFRIDDVPFSGRGEVLNLKFMAEAVPYSLDCEVVKRVRFSDRLMGGMEPRAPVGYKLAPLSNVVRNEKRQSLRFAHARGARGPQVFPNFRLDLFVERVRLDGPANERLPEVIPVPGVDPVTDEVRACDSPEALVRLFHKMLALNPAPLQQVHLSKVLHDARRGSTSLLDLGHTPVLGLRGEQKGFHLHLRSPRAAVTRDRKAPERAREGDVMVLRFVVRDLARRRDIHYRWDCRVHRCGVETLVLRPRGSMHRQTGLPAVVRDFSLGGVALQNSPTLEAYLLGEAMGPADPESALADLVGGELLLHFHPRLHFPKDLEAYRPQVPSAFAVLGEIVRGSIETRKDTSRISQLGIVFRYDPSDYDPETLEINAWDPLRGFRENPHFKEVHRAMNSLTAFLDK